MKYNLEDIIKSIKELSKNMGRLNIMEVCGTHTSSIHKYGIGECLPDNIRLVSGPGCPVCVTSQRDIATALSIASSKDVIFTCFGDIMRVPCSGTSLYSLYEKGSDVRVIISPMDALRIARNNPDRQIVYFGIGFETTAPHTAALIEEAQEDGIKNLSVFSAHKTMPQAIKQLLKDSNTIDGLICPGHVASITGSKAFSFIPEELMLPAVVAGFEAYDILIGILAIIRMLKDGEKRCMNMYPRAVSENGNKEALNLLYKVFEPCDSVWRGLGEIKESGLAIKECYREFDAAERFNIEIRDIEEPKGCICGRILRGKSIPTECSNFANTCTPENPQGACMVSSEGSCAIYYNLNNRGV